MINNKLRERKLVQAKEWFIEKFNDANFYECYYRQNYLYIKYDCGNPYHKIKDAKWIEIKRGFGKYKHLACSCCQELSKERMVRHTLNTIFNTTFNKVRFSFMKNENNNTLELDGYASISIENIIYNIAFEYQGEQHYRIIKRSNNQTDEYLKKQFEICVKNDKIKVSLCEINDIKLIIIPYDKFSTYNLDFFCSEFKRLNIPVVLDNIKINYDNLKNSSLSKEMFDKLSKICAAKNIGIVSNRWLGAHIPLEFECLNKKCAYRDFYPNPFRWKIKPCKLFESKIGCKVCSKQVVLQPQISEKALANNCDYIESSWISARSLLKFKCLECQYEFYSNWYGLSNSNRKGKFCPSCRTGL